VNWFPLSRLQLGAWLEYVRNPKSCVFNRGTTLRLTGKIDPDALRAAWDAVVARHDSLRMVIRADGQRIVQAALENPPPSFSVVDASAMDEADAQAEAQRTIEEPFDLERGPAVRARLLLRPDEAIFVIGHPHAHADIVVLDTMLHEIGALYTARLRNEKLELPLPAKSYADFVASHEQRLEGDKLERYWKSQLDDAPKALGLPTDHPRSANAAPRRGTHPFKLLDARGNEALERLCRATGASRYRVLMSAWIALLHRYTAQDDIVVGMLADCRDRSFEGAMGSFTNIVSLRVRVTPEMPFSDLVRQVTTTIKNAIEHRHYPFSLAVERLLDPGDRSKSPFFQTLFALGRLWKVPELSPIFLTSQPIPWQGKLGSIDVRGSVPVRPHFSSLDVELFAVEVHGELGAEIGFDANLFEHQTIARWAGHLSTLLAAVLHDESTPIGKLPLLDADERRAVTETWSGHDVPFTASTMDRLFELQAARTPDAPAIEEGPRVVSYGDLDARANRIARLLRERGVGLTASGEQPIVGVLLERSADVVASFLAVWKAQAAYVPLDASYPEDRIALMIRDAAPRLLIVSARTRHLAPPGVATIDLEADGALIEAQDSAALAKDTTPGSLAYVIYTSGSTGVPKGVLIEHRGVCNYVQDVARRWALSPRSRILGFASFSFDSSVADFGGALAAGATLIVRPDEVIGGNDLAKFVDEARITHLQLPPAVWATLPPTTPLKSVQTAVMSGDAASSELVDRFAPGRTLLNEYGPTEITVCATSYTCQVGTKPLIGRPIANVRAYVLDHGMQPVPIGVAGELYLDGVGRARGYLNQPELTRERFVPSPFSAGSRLYRTGDRVRWRASGDLEFLGRFDDQIKIRGFRIELGEVEAAMRDLPEVEEAVVVVRETSKRAKHLVGYFKTNPGRHVDVSEVRARLRHSLPPYMVPVHLTELERLPLNANGKVDRRALPAPVAEDGAPRSPVVATSLEQSILTVMRGLLGRPDLGPLDDFFENGGDSLLAIDLSTEASAMVGREVTVLTIFEASSAHRLAARLENGHAHGVLVELRAAGSRPPLFCVHAAGGDVLAYFALAERVDEKWPVVAIRSRAVEDPNIELGSVEELAASYADAIVQRQAAGPIHLLGWSLGGVLALAIAHELQRRGRAIGFLGLIDAWPKSLLVGNALAEIAPDIGDLASVLSRLTAAELEQVGARIAALGPGLRFREAMRIAMERGLLGADEKLPFNPRAADLQRRHIDMVERYRLPAVASDIHFWRADRSPPTGAAPWHRATRGRIFSHVLSGNHYTIMLPPQVTAAAEAISKALEALGSQRD
jgi:amino acid adenylation domain-containing protein